MYTVEKLVERTKHVCVTEDGRFVVTDLAPLTSRRKGCRVTDTRAASGEVVGFVTTLAAAVKLINEYVEQRRAGATRPTPARRRGLP